MKVHVRYQGKSRTLDMPAELLETAPDWRGELLRRLVQRGALPAAGQLSVVVDRHPDGVVVRPPAVWG